MFIRILKVSSILILNLLLFKRNVEASNVLLETFLECLHCKGPNCDEPKSITCKNAPPDDQCFILFNTQNDIIEMGCISDQDDNFINNNIHSLFMCNNDNNCNDFINIPKPNICLQCNSLNNTDCASQPENVQDKGLCKTLPNTQCFININSDGSTERGCASDLNRKNLLACLNGNSSNCFICDTDKCNQKLFPDTRRSCHRCNTKDNANCEISPAAASICPIYSDAQFCATKLVNGHTYRGCSTEFQCDSTDKQYCRLCYDADNCNVETLKDNNIGYPGKWQTSLPISCYSCKGSECLNTNDEMKKQCQGSVLQNCVTVFNETGPVIERGCSDEIYTNPIGNYCDQNPKYCKFCKSNNCNSANSLNNYTDCLFCDSNEDKNCVLNVHNIQQTRSCHGGCITALYPRSAEENPAYDLTRSCLDDLEEADRNKCSFNETYCQTCTNHLCNKVNLGERLKCYTCEGEECEVPTSSECPSFREHDHCFILFSAEDNNIVQMGCVSDVDTDFFNINRRQLFLCEGNNCNDVKNIPSIHSCKSCDSHTEPDCATGYSQKLKQCPKLPHTACYTRLDEDGITHRGCLADLTDDIFYDCIATGSSNRTCKICESNNCNSEVYPKGRRSCYRCDSLSYAACENNPSSFSGICPTYNENDACITTLEGNRTRRDCTSELICDPSKRDSCRLCNGTNDCNAVNLRAAYIGPPGRWQNVPLSCLLCEGRGCENSNNVTTQKCEGNSLQTCLTVFELNGTVAMRGCSDTVAQLYGDYCDINQDYCMACKSTHCNNAQNLQDYVDCYFCDSQNNPFCTQNFDGQGTQVRKCQKSCMLALYPRNNSTDSAYELTRSCLDDLEIDDRDKCGSKVNPYCIPCQDAKCNSMNFPEERHECYHCANSTCEDVITSTCKLFHPNEQCYILFDNENSIQNVGCRSDLSSGITELIKKKKLLVCNGINCNSLDVIPTAKMCTTCNSKEEPLCATNPNLIVRTERCAILPYTDCYTRINKEGYTERGCLSSLDDNHFLDCLMGNDTLCENCFGEQCNKNDIFPVDRLKCHQCNSLNNSQCTTDPDSIEICPIYKKDDKCLTNFRNGITTRGCASSMNCDNENNKLTCQLCNTNGCNTMNLEKINAEGIPGKWQDIPLTCYTCKNRKECQDKGVFRPCPNNPFQNCMTVFSKEGFVIRRGCSDIVKSEYEAYCQINPNNCMHCFSNGCNLAKSLNEYVECLSCDSDSDGDCVNNVNIISRTRKCYNHCMTALYPRSNETDPSYGLSRSCYDDMDQEDRENCVNDKNNFCRACDQPKCNTVAMPEMRLSCYVCEGDDCQDPKTEMCRNYRFFDKCYIRYDESHAIVSMGCRSEFSNWEADQLLKQKLLLLCDSDNCNSYENLPSIQQCALCNSRTDSNCSISPSDIKSKTSCRLMPYTQCYTRILTDGATERGCLSNLHDDEFVTCLNGNSSTCESCQGDNCNLDIYPSDRLKCHQCSSENDPLCTTAPNSNKPCLHYKANDSCVTNLHNAITTRDCVSSLQCNDEDNKGSCQTCSFNGCNTIDLGNVLSEGLPGKWQDIPLTCYTCKNRKECQDKGVFRPCPNNPFQNCMTVFSKEGFVIRRGCSDIVKSEYDAYCHNNTDKCMHCNSNGCNLAKSLNEYIECLSCDSNLNSNCIDNVNSVNQTRMCYKYCMSALYPRSNETDPSYGLSRSCYDDMDQEDRENCVNDKNNFCRACDQPKCNTVAMPEMRLSCYVCEGDDCQDPKTEMCRNYRFFDKCYIRYDESHAIVSMGCRSEFSNWEADQLLKQKLLLLCDSDNCNSYENLPSIQQCALCNSRTDSNCSISPSDIKSKTSCRLMPYTQCYTRILTDGATERGCLSNLYDDEFVTCLNGNSSTCESCQGDNCNLDIYPSDRLKCHQCSSENDPLCTTAPNSNKPCLHYKANDSCVTNLHNAITTRDCVSSLQCNDEDNKGSCQTCSFNGCNTIDLGNVLSEGLPGKWQDIPLTCYTCKNRKECQDKGVFRPCPNNPFQNCMTVFSKEGFVIRRGCSDIVKSEYDAYCHNNTDKCMHCNSNGCNLAKSLNEYIECLSCDSNLNSNCIDNVNSVNQTRMCYKYCMSALYPRSNETDPSYGLSRSCYDDMDQEDRENCVNDKNNFCRACDQPKCNTVAMSEMRLSCYVCEGDDCQDPKTEMCRNYRFFDKCYIRYDESHAIVSMGCRSEFSNWEADQLLKQKLLLLCDSDNCNSYENLPSIQQCALCNSRTDSNCSISPSDIKSKTSCRLMPYTQCYTRILTDGATERGCLSNLHDDEFVTCLNGNSSTCESCQGDNCNLNVYPSDRLKCHICDSDENKQCENHPQSLKVCPTYMTDDTCVTTLLNNITHRNCSSSWTCESEDSRLCQKCSGDGCNIVNLAKKQDDNFGKWQTLPLKCFTCKGSECKTLNYTQTEKCGPNVAQDCMIVFDDEGEVVRRGCADVVEYEYYSYCEKHKDNCFNCKSNECNSATLKSQFFECIYCDSAKDTDCLWNSSSPVRFCQRGCMTALYSNDKESSSPSYDLIRTCLTDKESDDQDFCAEGSDNYCTACFEPNCNVAIIPDTRLSCYTCLKNTCENPQTHLCSVYKNDDKCFIRFNEQNSISEMGCLSSLRNETIEEIIKSKRVALCEGENCNSLSSVPKAHKCAACNSTDNLFCATSPKEVGSVSQCNMMPYTNCYSKLNNDGTTERGCLSDLPADDFANCLLSNDTNCSICSGDVCNKNIFPEDRQQCYTCSSEHPDCQSFPTLTRPCPIINATESCITAMNPRNNHTTRGCKSTVYCDENDPTTCRSCFGSKCNAIDLVNRQDDNYHGIWQELPLRCYNCKEEHCQDSLGMSTTCSSKNINQDCKTVFTTDGKVKRRGCSDDVDDYEDFYCRQHPELCFTCKSNDCNIAWNLTDYKNCLFCDSNNDLKCIHNPNDTNILLRKCYKDCVVAMRNNQLIRSCLDDKEWQQHEMCFLNNKDCFACSNENCNKFVFPKDRLKCHVCNDQWCSNTTAIYCENYDENDHCFAKYNSVGNIELMGCISSIDNSTIIEWTTQNLLYKCKDHECNDLSQLPKERTCLKCDSEKTPNCAQQPTQITTIDNCPPANSQCYTRLSLDGHTLRGCSAYLNITEQSCIEEGTCTMCSGDKCNDGIFPSNRRQCYICDTTYDNDCAEHPMNPQICLIYNSNDGCGTKFENGILFRGCTSHITCDPQDKDNCEICHTNGCNTVDLRASSASAKFIQIPVLLINLTLIIFHLVY